MSQASNHEHINFRRRLASRDAKLVARSRDILWHSLELLRKPTPLTFLGKQREPDKRQPDDPPT